MNEQTAGDFHPRPAPSSAPSGVALANDAIRSILRAGQPYVGPEEIAYLAPHIRVIFTTVPVELATQDAYLDKKTKLWVTSNRLHLRILRAAGVDITAASGPIETGNAERIEYRMCARGLWFDGRYKEWTACYELNLDAWRQELEASATKDKNPATQLNEIRKHGLSRAESGARGRLVQLLGLDRRGFTMDAIKRGFKVASPVIDVGDDQTGRDMLLAASLGLAGTLYGATGAPTASRPRPEHAPAPHPQAPTEPPIDKRARPEPEPKSPAADSALASSARGQPSAPPRATTPRFDELGAEKQIAVLTTLATQKGYSLASLKTANGVPITVDKFTLAQRLKFYGHLSSLTDAGQR